MTNIISIYDCNGEYVLSVEKKYLGKLIADMPTEIDVSELSLQHSSDIIIKFFDCYINNMTLYLKQSDISVFNPIIEFLQIDMTKQKLYPNDFSFDWFDLLKIPHNKNKYIEKLNEINRKKLKIIADLFHLTNSRKTRTIEFVVYLMKKFNLFAAELSEDKLFCDSCSDIDDEFNINRGGREISNKLCDRLHMYFKWDFYCIFGKDKIFDKIIMTDYNGIAYNKIFVTYEHMLKYDENFYTRTFINKIIFYFLTGKLAWYKNYESYDHIFYHDILIHYITENYHKFIGC